MAQSALTVTAPNPTPPTNLVYVGATPPLDPAQSVVDDGIPAFTAALATWNENAAGAGGPSRVVFNSNTAAAGSGTSVAHEGRGTETLFTQTYSGNVFAPIPLTMVGCGPPATAASILAGPNATHASSLSPATNPTLTTIAPTTSVHGTAAITMTATGVGFTRQSKIVIAGVPQATTFVSATSLTCLATPPAAAGTPAVTVVTGGVVTTAPQTWTIT